MTATPDMNLDALARQLLDDLLWLRACSRVVEGLQDDVTEMLTGYTDDTDTYSDGSAVWEDWTEDLPPGYAPPNPRAALHLPPHRHSAEKPGHAYGFRFATAIPFFSPIVRGPDWYEREAEINAFIAAMKAGGYKSGGADLISELDRREIEHSVEGYNDFVKMVQRETAGSD